MSLKRRPIQKREAGALCRPPARPRPSCHQNQKRRRKRATADKPVETETQTPQQKTSKLNQHHVSKTPLPVPAGCTPACKNGWTREKNPWMSRGRGKAHPTLGRNEEPRDRPLSGASTKIPPPPAQPPRSGRRLDATSRPLGTAHALWPEPPGRRGSAGHASCGGTRETGSAAQSATFDVEKPKDSAFENVGPDTPVEQGGRTREPGTKITRMATHDLKTEVKSDPTCNSTEKEYLGLNSTEDMQSFYPLKRC